MHEMALTRTAVDMVLEAAEAANAAKVTSITVTIGYCRDIVEDLYVDLFARLLEGTIAEDAELILKRTPFMARCDQCGSVYHIDVYDRNTWNCPCCNSENRTVISGMEYSIDDIGIVDKESEPKAQAA